MRTPRRSFTNVTSTPKQATNDAITPPSKEPLSSPPSAPKSISARGKTRLTQQPRSDSPSEKTSSARKGRASRVEVEVEAEEGPKRKRQRVRKSDTGLSGVKEVDTQTITDREERESAEEDSKEVGSELATSFPKEAIFERRKIIEEQAGHSDAEVRSDGEVGKEIRKVKKRGARKTKEQKDAENMPLAARTKGLKKFVGAHVSIAKGIQNSVTNSVNIGGNAFALFLKSQRQWASKPLEAENRDLFREMCEEQGYDATSHVLPHGSYLVNLAQEEPAKAKQAYDAFLDDLKRCEELGIKLYNFHPGASGSSTAAPAITRIASGLNNALSATSTVMPVLENMAGSGTVIGSTFESLASVISQIKPDLQHRIGVCIDTCHSFAAGYDLRTPESFATVLEEFDKIVGMKYLKALHINDSKAPLGSHRDLHANIGTGFLGLRAFHNVMNEPRFENLPLILETPIDKPDPSDPTGKKTVEDKSVWAGEIKLLESLIGMDAGSAEFRKLEKELSEKGKAEKAKMQAQFEKKVDAEKKKEAKKLSKEKGQGTLSWGKGTKGEGNGGEKENGC
jgi:AP endonuclease 1